MLYNLLIQLNNNSNQTINKHDEINKFENVKSDSNQITQKDSVQIIEKINQKVKKKRNKDKKETDEIRLNKQKIDEHRKTLVERLDISND